MQYTEVVITIWQGSAGASEIIDSTTWRKSEFQRYPDTLSVNLLINKYKLVASQAGQELTIQYLWEDQ